MEASFGHSSSTMPGQDGSYHNHSSVLISARPIHFLNSELFRGNCENFNGSIEGFANVETGNKSIVWHIYHASLGHNTPTNCRPVELTFEPSTHTAPEVIKGLEEVIRYEAYWKPSAELLDSLR